MTQKTFKPRHFVFERKDPEFLPAVGDTVEYTRTVGYKMVQDQPFPCRTMRWLEDQHRMGTACQCENQACYGVTTAFNATVTAVNSYMDNSVEVRTSEGHTLMWDYPHGDACF